DLLVGCCKCRAGVFRTERPFAGKAGLRVGRSDAGGGGAPLGQTSMSALAAAAHPCAACTTSPRVAAASLALVQAFGQDSPTSSDLQRQHARVALPVANRRAPQDGTAGGSPRTQWAGGRRPGGRGSRRARHGWRAPESGQEALTEGKATPGRQGEASIRRREPALGISPLGQPAAVAAHFAGGWQGFPSGRDTSPDPRPGSLKLRPARPTPCSMSQDLLDRIDQRTRLAGHNRLALLLFRLGSRQLFGVNVFKVKEVLQRPPLFTLPQLPKAFAGAADVRGRSVPVLDLARAIGHGDDEPGEPRYLVVTEFNRTVQGFLVAGVDRIVNIAVEHIQPPPDLGGEHHYLTGVARHQGELIQLIDVESVLAESAPRGS